MKTIVIASIIFISSLMAEADTVVTNTKIGFTAYLPANWICTQTSDSTAILNDSSFTYKSQIAIKKYLRNKTDFPTSNDWTRAHFIAYLLVTQYSYDPFGAVLYFDSTVTCKQDSFWATEAFSEFYTIDTLVGAWDEFIRFTAAGDYGYSLYAIGDTSDMKKNIGIYAAIIQSIHLSVQQSAAIVKSIPPHANRIMLVNAAMKDGVFDLLGKRVLPTSMSHSVNIYPQSGSKLIRIKVK
jgi:hypothetical protein